MKTCKRCIYRFKDDNGEPYCRRPLRRCLSRLHARSAVKRYVVTLNIGVKYTPL